MKLSGDRFRGAAQVGLCALGLCAWGLTSGCALFDGLDNASVKARASNDALDAEDLVDTESLGDAADVFSDADGLLDADGGQDAADTGEAPPDCGGVGYMGSDESGQPACIYAEQLASGARHTCALMSDHSLWCWGSNASGQLGYVPEPGSESMSAQPRQVRIVVGARNYSNKVLGVAAGAEHTCAVVETEDPVAPNTYFCWGSNEFGQLGIGAGDESASWVGQGKVFGPTPVVLGDDIKSQWRAGTLITAGKTSTCASFNNTNGNTATALICWGSNRYGQLGYGGGGGKPEAGEAASYSPWPNWVVLNSYGQRIRSKRIASGAEHVCALGSSAPKEGYDSKFGIFCWGRNGQDQILDRANNPIFISSAALLGVPADLKQFLPAIPAGKTFVLEHQEFTAGAAHTCSRIVWGEAQDGAPATGTEHVVCWGDNSFGQTQLPPNKINVSNVYEILLGASDAPIGELAAGNNFTCVVGGAERHVTCWGENSNRQLGLQDSASHNAQLGAKVMSVADSSTPLLGVSALAPGGQHVCALVAGAMGDSTEDAGGSQIVCWGSNDYSQLAKLPEHTGATCGEQGARSMCTHQPVRVEFAAPPQD